MNQRWVVGLIVAFGAALRFFQIGHGLPEIHAVDGFKFVGEAARIAASGDWTPKVFQYPGLLTNLLAMLDLLFGINSDFGQYLSARIVLAVAGTTAIPLTYLLARRVCTAPAAVFSAVMVATSPSLVTYSRMAAPDMLMSTLMLASLSMLLVDNFRIRTAIGAGLCAGAAVGAKFSALYLLPFVVLIPVLVASNPTIVRRLLRSALALLASLFAFSLTTPSFWLHAPVYISRFLRETDIQRYGQIGRVQAGYFDYLISQTPTWEQPWLGTSIACNLGWAFLVTAVAAVGWAFRGHRKTLVLGCFVLGFMVFVSGPGRVKAYRFLLPVLPVLFVLTGWLLNELKRRWRSSAALPATLGLAAVLLVHPILHTGSYLSLMMRPTSNELAAAWIDDNVPPGSRVLLSPFFVANLAQCDLRAITIPNVGSRQYARPPEVGPSPERQPIYDPAMLGELQRAGVQYLVTNSYFDDAFSPVPENLRFFPLSVRLFSAYRQELQARSRCLLRIDGFQASRLGPDIEIWQLP